MVTFTEESLIKNFIICAVEDKAQQQSAHKFFNDFSYEQHISDPLQLSPRPTNLKIHSLTRNVLALNVFKTCGGVSDVLMRHTDFSIRINVVEKRNDLYSIKLLKTFSTLPSKYNFNMKNASKILKNLLSLFPPNSFPPILILY